MSGLPLWTDTAHRFNVLRLSPQGQELDHVQLGAQFGAAGPTAESLGLSVDRGTGHLLLTWVQPEQTVSRLFFSTSPDAV